MQIRLYRPLYNRAMAMYSCTQNGGNALCEINQQFLINGDVVKDWHIDTIFPLNETSGTITHSRGMLFDEVEWVNRKENKFSILNVGPLIWTILRVMQDSHGAKCILWFFKDHFCQLRYGGNIFCFISFAVLYTFDRVGWSQYSCLLCSFKCCVSSFLK